MMWIVAALLIGYVIGSMRTFAFSGFRSESIGMAFVTMQPWFGGFWRGEVYWGDKTKP